MAIKVQNTTVVDDGRNILNIRNATLTGNTTISGHLGIGVANPSEKLQLNGSIRLGTGASGDLIIRPSIATAVPVGGSATSSVFTTSGNNSSSFHIGFEIPANDINDGFFVTTDSNLDGIPDKVALKIKANGNIGIGTTAPTEALDVTGNIAVSGGISANGSLGTSGQVLTSTGTGIVWSTVSGGGGSTNLSTTANSSTITILSDTGTGVVIEGANTTVAGIMTAEYQILKGHKLFANTVSIGTTTFLGNTLTVGGKLFSRDMFTLYKTGTTTSEAGIAKMWVDGTGLTIGITGALGNTGQGTSIPVSYAYKIMGGAASYGGDEGTATGHRWNVGAIEAMRLDSTGRLGLQTTTPSEVLHANGNIYATGSVKIGSGIYANNSLGTSGQILASTGTGIIWTNAPSVSTNLTDTANSSTVTIFSDTGTDAILDGANSTTAGVITAVQQTFGGDKTFTGQIIGNSADTNTAPAFTWSGDTNTGMYHPANDTISFVTAGTDRMRINNNGTIVLGANTYVNPNYKFVVDSGQTLFTKYVQMNDAAYIEDRVDSGTDSTLGLYVYSEKTQSIDQTFSGSKGLELGTVLYTLSTNNHNTSTGGALGIYNYILVNSNPGYYVELARGNLTEIENNGGGKIIDAVAYEANGIGSRFNTYYGFKQDNNSFFSANTGYGFYSDIRPGANNYNFYSTSSAKNYFGGETTFAGAAKAATGIIENSATIASNYTISTGYNAMSSGPITINSGVSVTVPTGSSWSII